MSRSVSVVNPACSPEATEPAVKANVEYSVEAPEPVVGTSSETITLSPINVGTDGLPKAFAVVPEVAELSASPLLS